MHRRRRASGDFVAASSSLPPVSEAANEFVEFFSPLAATAHCVQAAIDVDRVLDALERGRDGADGVLRATLFTDDDGMQSFLDAERRHRKDEEERDQQPLIELYRDLVEASTSRRRRTHRRHVFGASWLPDEEGRPSVSVAVAPQSRSRGGDGDPTRRRVTTRYCSSCRHDLSAETHFYIDRKTCKACLRYHVRYSRRKREKMEHTAKTHKTEVQLEIIGCTQHSSGVTFLSTCHICKTRTFYSQSALQGRPSRLMYPFHSAVALDLNK